MASDSANKKQKPDKTPEITDNSSVDSKKRGFKGALVSLFIGHKPEDENDSSLGYHTGGAGGVVYASGGNENPLVGLSNPEQIGGSALAELDGGVTENPRLPDDRRARYAIYEEMAQDPTLAEGKAIHLTHALSVSKRTGLCFEIAPVGDDESIAKELMTDIGFRLNQLVPVVADGMCVFGTNYVRPHIKEGAGITHFETGYYTLPHFVREYERAGELAGFTCDYMLDNGQITSRLQPPWAFIPMKIPYWSPTARIAPQQTGCEQVDLSLPPEARRPQETQNYGTSLFHNTYEPWVEFKEGKRCLRGARQISGNIERIIGLNTDALDPVRAAGYIGGIAASVKKAVDKAKIDLKRRGLFPTVMNRFIPIMGGGKGGMTVDTQVNTADIQHIEDVMLSVRRMCASIGLDMSMVGWADMMSGGLGEGGFLRTSLQAGMRAQWIRFAVQDFIERAIEIHMAAKHGKVFTDAYRPYKIVFNSLNTAIQEEESAERQGRAEFASIVVTVLDTIQNGTLAHSETFKRLILGGIVDADQKQIDAIIKELADAVANAEQQDSQMMESVGGAGGRFSDLSYQDIVDVVTSVLTDTK